LRQFQTENNSELVDKTQLEYLQEQVKESVSLKAEIPVLVQDELSKVQVMRSNEARRFRGVARVNAQTNPDWKVGASIPFAYMRRLSEVYPIARACINSRVRQVTQLEWDITTVDDKKDEKGYESQIKLVKELFKQPVGHKSKFSEMLTTMVNDILTIDAVSFEMRKTRGGNFMNLVPVDPATLVLRVTEFGGIPEPPEPAYEQIIDGQVLARFTTDEMIYESMNSRSYTPYGLSPLESLIIQVESALRGDLYNLDYFRENNVPEGFLTLPESAATTKDQVEEWQDWFDAILSGDRRMIHRLKILPAGSEYIQTKKPEDMSFEKFELWLAMLTCAMFEVQPQDIGLTMDVNKATGESQNQIGKEKGLIPLANFLKQIFDEIIQTELGFVELQFQWVNISPVNRKEEIEVAEKEIAMGALSVDEYRMEHGREPLGLNPYIRTGNQIVMVDDVVAGKFQERQDMALQAKNQPTEVQPKKPKEKPAEKPKEKPKAKNYEIDDLRKWRKAVLADIKFGREVRTRFPSDYIDEEIHKAISLALVKVHDRLQAKLLFDQFIDPELRASFSLLEYAEKQKQAQNDRQLDN